MKSVSIVCDDWKRKSPPFKFQYAMYYWLTKVMMYMKGGRERIVKSICTILASFFCLSLWCIGSDFFQFLFPWLQCKPLWEKEVAILFKHWSELVLFRGNFLQNPVNCGLILTYKYIGTSVKTWSGDEIAHSWRE